MRGGTLACRKLSCLIERLILIILTDICNETVLEEYNTSVDFHNTVLLVY